MSVKPKSPARGTLAVKKPAKMDVAIAVIEDLTLERVALYSALRDLLDFWDRRDGGQWVPTELIRLGEIRELATPAKGDTKHATIETKGKSTGVESDSAPNPELPSAAPGV